MSTKQSTVADLKLTPKPENGFDVSYIFPRIKPPNSLYLRTVIRTSLKFRGNKSLFAKISQMLDTRAPVQERLKAIGSYPLNDFYDGRTLEWIVKNQKTLSPRFKNSIKGKILIALGSASQSESGGIRVPFIDGDFEPYETKWKLGFLPLHSNCIILKQ